VDKVFLNLCAGLDRLGRDYVVNLPFAELTTEDRVGVIGRGRHALQGYDRKNPILAGVALMDHPSQWPNLLEEYPVARYLSHSKWVNEIYRRYFGECCGLWAVGIDTEAWTPAPAHEKCVDILIYDKVRWNREQIVPTLLAAIEREVGRLGLSSERIRYGAYRPEEFKLALGRCRAMVFLCEHESQGIAYLEALSSGVPVLAWDQGLWLDPARFRYGDPLAPATSVPFWDERCGRRFADFMQFQDHLPPFWSDVQGGRLQPRDYVCEHLTLAGCAERYCTLLEEING
jgi:hypothetical protein